MARRPRAALARPPARSLAPTPPPHAPTTPRTSYFAGAFPEPSLPSTPALQVSILAGDFLLARAAVELAQLDDPAVVEIMAGACGRPDAPPGHAARPDAQPGHARARERRAACGVACEAGRRARSSLGGISRPSAHDALRSLCLRRAATPPSPVPGCDVMGWDGMGWDGMGWDGMGWGLQARWNPSCVAACYDPSRSPRTS